MNARDLAADLRHGRRIGRAEFVRSVRRYTRDLRRLLGLGVAVLFFGGNLLVALPGVYVLGRGARSVASIPFFEPAATLLPVGLLALATLRTAERLGGVDGEALLLTTVHPRAVVVGLVTAELARLALWFGVPIVAAAGAFALGLGAPTLLVTAGLVALPLGVCTALWGYAAGIALLRLLRRLPTLRRVVTVGGVVALVAAVVLSQVAARRLVESGVSPGRLLSALAVAPLTDYVALAFVGTPLARPVTPGAAAVLLGLLALSPVGLVLARRQAVALWFEDAPARDGERSGGSTPRARSGFSPPRPFAWTPAGRVAWGVLVRAVRHPQDLAHLLALVFFAGPLGGAFSGTTGEGALVVLAGAGVVVGVLLSGATFGLNPLGDDRPQFPLLLLTETSPEAFLRGRTLAGLAVGLPVTVLVPLATLALGAPAGAALAFAASGVVGSVAAVLLAPGLGCAYPVYEAREVWGAETVAPSTLVLLGYEVVVAGGTVLGLVLVWYLVSGHLAPTPLLGVGVGLYLLVTVGVPLAAYRYARRRYRRYVLD